ncbi:MAG: hypothetical protein M1821_009721 [Bathelium mastoideum]|nr:MAG: hypothetical protein M1821_009721 [Bathelium mastoideum]
MGPVYCKTTKCNNTYSQDPFSFSPLTDMIHYLASNWGHATYYNPGGNLGSCGWPSDDSHHVVALSPSQNPKGHCGQHVWLKNVGGGNAGANGGVGRTIDAVVVDTCPRCGYSDIDIAEGAAWALHGPGLHEDGVFDVEW